MQIDIYKENSYTFKITDDGDNAVNIFMGIIIKMRDESKRKGFKNMFSHEEKLFIQEFAKIAIQE